MASAAPRIEEYDSESSTDSADTARTFKPLRPRSRPPLAAPPLIRPPPPHPYPPGPPRLCPQFRHSTASSSTSDTDSETTSPLLRANRRGWWSDDSRKWWTISRRRRRRHGRLILTLILLSVFTIFVTLLLMYILNPDKDPLPWRAYCSATPQFPPAEIDTLPPAGLLVGVFSIDSGYERRSLVRTTWASHVRSRNGAGDGDGGLGTSRTIVRFDHERRIRLEMETYNDIIILPVPENMNGGKTHTFFSWASFNAWVPPVYPATGTKPRLFSYSNRSLPPPPLAPHDPIQARQDRDSGRPLPWVRPDYVIKVDDDSFVMLAELEARLRVELHADPNKPAGAAPSHSSSDNANTSTLSVLSPAHALRSGDPLIYLGDKQTAKWMKIRGDEIRWVSERCWIYNHPKSGTVYTHGFLFPSEATRVKNNLVPYPDKALQDVLNSSLVPGGTPTPSDWAYSSVSTFGVRYVPPIPDLTIAQSIEALVEGSEMSTLREGSPKTPEYAWTRREGRRTRYQGQRVGGTVVVHFIKKNMWYLETALALLEGDEINSAEDLPPHDCIEQSSATGSAIRGRGWLVLSWSRLYQPRRTI
ncbi:glycosyltransferase family 31 protein [Mycena olivaceomarginata]|nr:glycosyltransferase family 31 protein [Mycena olivaceomarginata]